jgi:uncharacterized protein (DUF433 family)
MAPMSHLLGRITIYPEQCPGRPFNRGIRIRGMDVLKLPAAEPLPHGTMKQIPVCIDLDQQRFKDGARWNLWPIKQKSRNLFLLFCFPSCTGRNPTTV